MAVVLGIDYGERRVGLAISDPDGHIAFPAPALMRSNPRADLAALSELVQEREITRIVVGLPIHLNGRPGETAEKARRFARDLSEATGLPVDLLDERLTTMEAERGMQQSSTRRKRAKQRKSGELDSAAAAILLRTYLERERSLAERRATSEESRG